ncbi:MAG: hypothetical protein HY818_17665 [Acetobacterium woodii]|nr:hypothetical protein [Acetobacterium woodii]
MEERAYKVGLASAGLFLIGIVFVFFDAFPEIFNYAISLSSITLGVDAIIQARKELVNDPQKTKAKIGLILGVTVASLQLILYFIF